MKITICSISLRLLDAAEAAIAVSITAAFWRGAIFLQLFDVGIGGCGQSKVLNNGVVVD
jgi:hypothetical protein